MTHTVTQTVQQLQDKVVVVTGAGQGLGRAYAEHVAACGAAVVVAEVVAERGERTAADITAAGARALAVHTDVTDAESVAALVERTVAEFGRVDGLVNNAAIYDGLVPVASTDLDVGRWERVLRVNVWGSFLCARAVAPVMAAQGSGRIVNVGSTTALLGVPMMADYVASKGAVAALTRSLAREWGSDGITVNAIAPGGTWTEAAQHLFAGDGATPPDPGQVRAAAIAGQAIKRQEYPDDVVGAVAFLLSDAAAMITGQLLVIDGGMVLH
ncbi:SDR family NAD(P)-dependent oxidoreductase [Jatrophihabitans fulvus]